MGRKRSLPTRKSEDTSVSGLNSAFETNTQHCQVLPAGQGRSLTLSMKYRATALCRTFISLDFQSSRYWFRILSTHFFNLRAVSYFCQSFSPCRGVGMESALESRQRMSSNLHLQALCGKWVSLYKSTEMLLLLHSSASHCAATQLQVIHISIILNASMEATRETQKTHLPCFSKYKWFPLLYSDGTYVLSTV